MIEFDNTEDGVEIELKFDPDLSEPREITITFSDGTKFLGIGHFEESGDEEFPTTIIWDKYPVKIFPKADNGVGNTTKLLGGDDGK